MTSFRMTCLNCATVDPVPAEALLASVAGDEPPDISLAGTVSWICCCCQQVATVQLGWQSLLAVVVAGVPLLEEEAAPEAGHDLPPHPEHPGVDGRLFTSDDLLDLHDLLKTDGWFGALTVASTAT